MHSREREQSPVYCKQKDIRFEKQFQVVLVQVNDDISFGAEIVLR
jgi:hypothetical protein